MKIRVHGLDRSGRTVCHDCGQRLIAANGRAGIPQNDLVQRGPAALFHSTLL